MNTTSFYGKKKAVLPSSAIRLPPQDSDDSELTDDDRDETYVQPALHASSSEDEPNSDADDGDDDDDGADGNVPSTSGQSAREGRRKTAVKKPATQWRKRHLDNSTNEFPFTGNDDLPNNLLELKTPLQFFHQIFTTALEEMIVEQSNLFCIQTRPDKPLRLTQEELEQFLGCVLWMSLVKLSSTRRYWVSRYRVSIVSEVMSAKRWEEIKRFLHFYDNSTVATDDKLRKVRPVFDEIRKALLLIPKEEALCVDEQIIPFKGKSSLKQYNPRKPHKWGYKMYVLSGVSGFAYDMEFYTGAENARMPNEPDVGASGNIVMRLCRTVNPGVGHKIYYDNFFTTLDLMVLLHQRQIQSVATVRVNRLRGLPALSDADMKKRGRGSISEYVAMVEDVEVSCIRWFDNKVVSLMSTFVGAEPTSQISRWSKKDKSHINIQCPQVIIRYNKHMGGVDTLDSLMGMYRSKVRSKKYYLRIFFHLLDMAIVNAWLLYRRALKQMNSNDEPLCLSDFKADVAEGLCKVRKSGKRKRSSGRPSRLADSNKQQRKRLQPIPLNDVRSDEIAHWPEVDNDRRMHCRVKTCKGQTSIKCSKCEVYLCISSSKNCFKDYHMA